MQNGQNIFHRYTFSRCLGDCEGLNTQQKQRIILLKPISDAIRGTIKLMDAPSKKISVRTSYNFAAINFTPKELVVEIKKIYPTFICTYNPIPMKQRIADSWPQSIDDSVAYRDWGWKPEYNLKKLTNVMITGLKAKLSLKNLPKKA